jgi:ribosomal protein L14E/L6E/L27E
MDIEKSDIVLSAAGRDKGCALYVLGTEGEFLLTADGKRRRVERPKRKKRRHVSFLARDNSALAEKIRNNQSVTNAEVRTALAVFGELSHLDQEG